MTTTWRAHLGGPAPLILEVMRCQMVFQRLTKVSRTALLILAEDFDAAVHPLTRRSLAAHNLIDDEGLTEVGQLVVKWNRDREVSG